MKAQKKEPKKILHNLKEVVRRELEIELDKEHQKADWSDELTPEMVEYAAKDAQVLLPLAQLFESKVVDVGVERVVEIEHRALPAMVWMANAGIPFDAVGWEEHLKKIGEEIGGLKEELNVLVCERPRGEEWNWDSPQQTKEALSLVGLNLPNTGRKTLSRCNHPVADTLLKYRKASKMVSAFGPKLLRCMHSDGRIYASWRQIGAATGRMSCSKPNLQQIPNETLRRYIRALEGRVVVAADYSQAELRILAKASGDPALVKAFVAGRDSYKATAAGMFGAPEGEVTPEQRSKAKGVNLSIIYGTTPQGLAEGLDINVQEARDLMNRYFKAHPIVKAYLDETVNDAMSTGAARTLTGRIRWFGDPKALRGAKRKAAKRRAMNFPMQGTCADGLKLALALLHERRYECPGAVPILALHDEIMVECDESDVEKVKAWLEKAMIDGMDEVVNAPEIKGPHVPIEVDVKSGRTWEG